MWCFVCVARVFEWLLFVKFSIVHKYYVKYHGWIIPFVACYYRPYFVLHAILIILIYTVLTLLWI